MLRIEGLCASYGERLVLENVSMEVGKNEIVSLIGANGAGKSTVLKTIMGLLKPTSGSILLDGAGIGGRPVNSIVRSGISLCPEGRRVFGNMTIRENLEMGAYVRKGSISSDIEHIIELFPVLGERIN
ncbi:MAG TPA: ATP-binding cassette domain-containing protein, partial [Bacillota bacterium]|nr:ATP-binding cassette domain-containing protein [Bacillota bacterium]